MKIAYYGIDDNACDYYRLALPLQTAKEKDQNIQAIQRNNVNIVNDVETDPARFLNDMRADIIAVGRLMKESLMNRLCTFARDYGNSKVVLDYDDNIFDVSPLGPHYVDYGTKVYDFIVNGKTIPGWRDMLSLGDGQFFSIKKNEEKLDMIKRNIAKADLVTVCSEELKKVMSKFNPNVKVLPNCVDMTRWRKLPLKESDEIRLYWGGGASHYEDFYYLKDPLRIIFEKYKNVKLVLQGLITKNGKFKFSGLLETIPEDKIELYPWEHFMGYPYKTASINPTIGLIPLKDMNFNYSKSPIKWIELSAIEVPCVVSYVSPYKEMASLHKEDNAIFIEHNEDVDAWVKGISMLIDDIELRKKISKNAYETVLEHFDISKKYTLWLDAYREVLNVDSIKSDLN